MLDLERLKTTLAKLNPYKEHRLSICKTKLLPGEIERLSLFDVYDFRDGQPFLILTKKEEGKDYDRAEAVTDLLNAVPALIEALEQSQKNLAEACIELSDVTAQKDGEYIAYCEEVEKLEKQLETKSKALEQAIELAAIHKDSFKIVSEEWARTVDSVPELATELEGRK